MTKFKLSSKMHILIIISALIVAIGLAMGLVFQFVSDGYFNYGAEYKSYSSVVVNYAYVDLSSFGDEDGIKQICDEEFESNGVSYYSATLGETSAGGEYTFKFGTNVSADTLQKAVDAISAKLDGDSLSGLSGAWLHKDETIKGNENTYIYAAIAIASAIAFQFIYFVIRYKLTMAFGALLADIHNLAIFISLTAITRVPVGSSVAVFAVLTVLLTMIGCGYFFDKMRKGLKDENFAKLDTFEQVDGTVLNSLSAICIPVIFTAVIAALVLVLLSVSALSVSLVITPVALALISAVSTVYGTAFFTPAVYARFKMIGDSYKASHSKAKKS